MLMFSLNTADFLQHATDRDICVNISNYLFLAASELCLTSWNSAVTSHETQL